MLYYGLPGLSLEKSVVTYTVLKYIYAFYRTTTLLRQVLALLIESYRLINETLYLGNKGNVLISYKLIPKDNFQRKLQFCIFKYYYWYVLIIIIIISIYNNTIITLQIIIHEKGNDIFLFAKKIKPICTFTHTQILSICEKNKTSLTIRKEICEPIFKKKNEPILLFARKRKNYIRKIYTRHVRVKKKNAGQYNNAVGNVFIRMERVLNI